MLTHTVPFLSKCDFKVGINLKIRKQIKDYQTYVLVLPKYVGGLQKYINNTLSYIRKEQQNIFQKMG